MIFTLSLISLLLFCILGAFDGLYFHILKYQLHLNEDSEFEHFIHSVRAIVFAPIALFFYVLPSSGILLYVGIFFIALDLGLEIIDIYVEKNSRLKIGGISSTESVLHVFASSFRMTSLGLIIASKPNGSFRQHAPLLLDTALPMPLQITGMFIILFSIMGGAMSFKITKKSKYFNLKSHENLYQLET